MLHRITTETELPVTLREVKQHLRVEFRDDDFLIFSYMRAAFERLDGPDGYLGRCLRPQVWQLDLGSLDGEITLPLPPCQAVSSITYIDTTGASQTLPPDSYRVSGIGGTARIAPVASWPSTNSASITFTAGYTRTPEPIIAAIMLRVAHLYEHRESVVIGETATGLPLGEDDLIRNYRTWSF